MALAATRGRSTRQRSQRPVSEDSDIELRFQQQGERPPMPVHSQKLKLASSVFKHLINNVMEDRILSAAPTRRHEGTQGQALPILEVRMDQYQ